MSKILMNGGWWLIMSVLFTRSLGFSVKWIEWITLDWASIKQNIKIWSLVIKPSILESNSKIGNFFIFRHIVSTWILFRWTSDLNMSHICLKNVWSFSSAPEVCTFPSKQNNALPDLPKLCQEIKKGFVFVERGRCSQHSHTESTSAYS